MMATSDPERLTMPLPSCSEHSVDDDEVPGGYYWPGGRTSRGMPLKSEEIPCTERSMPTPFPRGNRMQEGLHASTHRRQSN